MKNSFGINEEDYDLIEIVIEEEIIVETQRIIIEEEIELQDEDSYEFDYDEYRTFHPIFEEDSKKSNSKF